MSAHDYAEGLRHGIALTLKLVIGEDPGNGGKPYKYPDTLPPDFVQWVRSAIDKVEDDRLVSTTIEEALYQQRPQE